MLTKEHVIKRAREFKAKHGMADEQDEIVVATLHLMATQSLDLQTAQERTSRGGSDHGIDAWHYDPATASLTLYQSKLTPEKARALKGFEGLTNACGWLADLLGRPSLMCLPRIMAFSILPGVLRTLTSPSEMWPAS